MKRCPCIGGLAEAGTGLILLAYPPIVVRLLFAAEISGAGVIMSRIAGIALIGLGVACWPGSTPCRRSYGMLTYSTLAMLYLIVHRRPWRSGRIATVAGSCGPCAPEFFWDSPSSRTRGSAGMKA